MFRFGIILICLGCTPPMPVDRDNCDREFMDQWWYIDPVVTARHNVTDTCLYVSSEGEVETLHYMSDIKIQTEWTCVGDNEIHISGRGYAFYERTEDPEVWIVNLDLIIPPVNDTAEVSDCYWQDW